MDKENEILAWAWKNLDQNRHANTSIAEIEKIRGEFEDVIPIPDLCKELKLTKKEMRELLNVNFHPKTLKDAVRNLRDKKADRWGPKSIHLMNRHNWGW